jgi:hypothetical protein
MAVVCIIIFTVGFVCVRRRRRKFGLKRKERMEKTAEGETPDEEIAKKLKSDTGVPEIGGAEVKTANTGAVEADGNAMALVADEKKAYMGDGTVSELPVGTETEIQELPVQEHAHEVGEGGFFVAELDSKEIERMKSLRATRRPGEDATVPPLPTQREAEAVTPSIQHDVAVPTIVVENSEEKKV